MSEEEDQYERKYIVSQKGLLWGILQELRQINEKLDELKKIS